MHQQTVKKLERLKVKFLYEPAHEIMVLNHNAIRPVYLFVTMKLPDHAQILILKSPPTP